MTPGSAAVGFRGRTRSCLCSCEEFVIVVSYFRQFPFLTKHGASARLSRFRDPRRNHFAPRYRFALDCFSKEKQSVFSCRLKRLAFSGGVSCKASNSPCMSLNLTYYCLSYSEIGKCILIAVTDTAFSCSDPYRDRRRAPQCSRACRRAFCPLRPQAQP